MKKIFFLILLFSACEKKSSAPVETLEKKDPPAAAIHLREQILAEVLRVVINRSDLEAKEFYSLSSALAQGASIEGLYNGIIHSDRYRKLEVASGPASTEALALFCDEMVTLQGEIKAPTFFDETSSAPLAYAVTPVYENAPTVQKNSSAKLQTLEELSKLFSKSSIFTLKRVLGDEALKLIEEKATAREDLAVWYGKWTTRVNSRPVDMGLALRNHREKSFHSQWAMTSSVDALRWEVLNRLHRSLNSAQSKK